MDSVICCNYTGNGSYVTKGAKCYVLSILNNPRRRKLLVLARAKDHKHVPRHFPLSQLNNFRLKPIHPLHPRYTDLIGVPSSVEDLEYILSLSKASVLAGS